MSSSTETTEARKIAHRRFEGFYHIGETSTSVGIFTTATAATKAAEYGMAVEIIARAEAAGEFVSTWARRIVRDHG